MRVVGTAGHVDHGKSTLVKALTGIDPDRLKEEKAREMTIDLGFAWLTLPSGEAVGIVDVRAIRISSKICWPGWAASMRPCLSLPPMRG
jgi:translation initiation factor 2 gamma subunit (eIF-2gamma)